MEDESKPKNIRKMSTNMGRFPTINEEASPKTSRFSFLHNLRKRFTSGGDKMPGGDSDEEGELPGADIKVIGGEMKKDETAKARKQLSDFFNSRQKNSRVAADDSTTWKPPQSWAVVKPVNTTRSVSPNLVAKLEAMNTSSTNDVNLWVMRIYRPTRKLSATDPFASDSLGLAFATLSVPTEATVADIYPTLVKRFCGNGSAAVKYRLFVSHGGGDFMLEPEDVPVLIQQKLFALAGYTGKEEVDAAAREDYSYICRFVFRELPTAGTQWQLRFDIYRNRHGRRSSWFNVDRQLSVTPEKALLGDENLAFLPSAVFEHIQSLQVLDVSANSLLSLPEDLLMACQNLKVLKVGRNFMKRIPESFKLLSSLEHLDLCGNDLRDDGLGPLISLESLKFLNLSGNHLSIVPSLPSSLNVLNISNNLLMSFAPISQLFSLEELDVSLNYISHLEELSNLRKLIAYGNKLATGFTVWPKLLYLDISHNPIEGSLVLKDSEAITVRADCTLFTSVFLDGAPLLAELCIRESMLTNVTCTQSLPMLKILDLSGNRLSMLPEDLFKLHMNQLEHLRLDNNRLGTMPSLEACNELTFVSLAFNQLTDLGMRDALPRLETLCAQNNNLKKISRSVWHSGLKKLNLASNFLPNFPTLEGTDGAKLRTTLEYLSLANNSCSAEVLYSIAELQNLKVLHLGMNQIYNFPEEVVFPTLTELSLSHNQLASLPETIGKFACLQRLYVNDNRLVSVPGDLRECKELRLIDLNGNNLRYNICNEPYDWNWNSNPLLQWMDLGGNSKLDLASSKYNPLLLHLNVVGMTVTGEQLGPLGDGAKVRTEWTEYPSVYPVAVSECPSQISLNGIGIARHTIYDVSLGKFGDDTREDLLMCVFDGKSSPVASAYLYQVYPEVLYSMMRKQMCLEDTLRLSFLTCNLQMSNQPLFDSKAMATAAVAYLREADETKTLTVANVGDVSVIVVKSNGTFVTLSTEHTVTKDIERIKQASGGLASPHMLLPQGTEELNEVGENAESSVSRAFGALHLTPLVTACPTTLTYQVEEEDVHVLIMTHSLRKAVSMQIILDVMSRCEQDIVQAAQRIRDIYLTVSDGRFEAMVLVASLRPTNVAPSSTQSYQGRRRQVREEVLDLSLARLPKEIEPPEEQVALVFTDIRESTVLWESNHVAMRAAQKMHHLIMRRQLRILGGYEVKTEGDAFMVAFPRPELALKWCITVQRELLNAEWPEDLLKLPICKTVVGKNQESALYRGISVRMGLHWGRMESEVDPVTGRMDYNGVPVIIASRVSSLAQGGEILITKAVYDRVKGFSDVWEECEAFDQGLKKLKGIEATEQIYEVYPRELSDRRLSEK